MSSDESELYPIFMSLCHQRRIGVNPATGEAQEK
jgi:hypothetical protein